MKFSRPPINEVGLSVSFAEPSLFDGYDIRALHDLFRAHYPIHERQAPTDGNDMEAAFGLPPLAPSASSRWWFIASNSADILQLQENYIARNWRRTVSPDHPPSYPGFAKLLSDFERDLATVKNWRESLGYNLPDARSCELMYDDVIPVEVGNQRFELSNMLKFWNPISQTRPFAGWQCAWVEPVVAEEANLAGNLQVQILAAAMTQDDAPPRPILRIIWKASTLNAPLHDVGIFFRAAHERILSRFSEMLTAELMDSWT